MINEIKKNIYLTSNKFEAERNYWSEKLSGNVMLSGFPTNAESQVGHQDLRGEQTFIVNQTITDLLRKIAGNSDYGSFMIMVTSLQWLLHKYTSEEDITIGIPNLSDEKEGKILPLRTKFLREISFKTLLHNIKTDLTDLESNCNLPFDILAEFLGIEPQIDHFKVTAIMETLHTEHKDLKRNGISFSFNFLDDILRCKIYYTNLEYDENMIQSIFNHFERALDLLINNPAMHLSKLEFVPEHEKNIILNKFNNTKVSFPNSKTIATLFEEQVKKTPERLCVMSPTTEITYLELNRKAQCLANYLVQNGVQSGNPVGFLATRSVDTIIGILGIIKSGGVYVPIDSSMGTSRIEYILDDCKINILLSSDAIQNDFGRKIIDLRDSTIYETESMQQAKKLSSREPLYIMYTSGTTGNPKGILVSHENVARLVMNTNFIDFIEHENMLQTGSITFDAFTFEMWGALLHGGTLHLVDHENLLHAESFKTIVQQRKITSLFLTPALFSQLLDQNASVFEGVNNVVVGGDVLPYKSVNKVRQFTPQVKIINGYGPTENTTFSTSYTVDKEFSGKIPIGKPINNSTVYIVDQYGNLQPIGVPGEILVGGSGVAIGYLNNEQLTKDKFIQMPFKLDERVYKTGDIGLWLEDGNIEYLGRKDDQAKIRGYRVELQEIKSILLSHPFVKDALVITRSDGDAQRYLCAYIIGEKYGIEEEIRNYLRTKLPGYMVPSLIIMLENFPLTINGKLNYKELPVSAAVGTSDEEEVSENELEEIISEIWKSILKVNKVSFQSSFFDLGGNSLLLATLATQMRKKLSVKISMKDLFRLTTIREQATFLKEKKSVAFSNELSPLPRQEFYLTSSAQKRIYVLDCISATRGIYNIPIPLEITGEINTQRAEQAFNQLINRHEILRTSYVISNGKSMQQVNECLLPFELPIQKINRKDLENKMLQAFTPFDLSKLPLMKANLFCIDDTHHVLLINFHHIILDGISLSVIIKEFLELYKGNELQPLNIQYKEFADWQQKNLLKDTIKNQEKYWLSVYSDGVPSLELPTDYPMPKARDYRGNTYYFKLPSLLKGKIDRLAKETNATLSMILHAFFSMLISKYSSEEDLVIGIPVSARTIPQIQEMLGMFVNTLAIRTAPEATKSVLGYIEEIKDSLVEALENQEYPFEELVEKLNVGRDTARNPIFNIMFAMQNMEINHFKTENITLNTIEFPYKFSKFDLTLFASESKEDISFSFEYSTQLFKEETIKKMALHFITLIENSVDNVTSQIGDISLLSEKEKKDISENLQFNKLSTHDNKKTVIDLFNEQVKLYPDKFAVSDMDKQLTYTELNEKANKLANHLLDRITATTKNVAVILENTVEIAISIMGILKAGLVFIPIDPNQPEKRISYILEETSPCAIITEKSFSSHLILNSYQIKLNQEFYETESPLNPNRTVASSDLAYIIYTSGSTGIPKGVMIEHKNLTHYFNWFCSYSDMGSKDRFLLLSSYSFDLGYTGLFSSLISGAGLHIVRKDLYKDPNEVLSYIASNEITYIKVTPSMFKLLSYADKEYWNRAKVCLRLIVLGGEELKTNQIRDFLQEHPTIQIMNHYGPTETCIGTIAGYIGINDLETSSVPLGKPISNSSVYVLNERLQLVPFNIPGEIFIAGNGLARGYHNQENLTKENFIINPFNPNERLYKTGDIGRIREDGKIEFLGRKDNQLKFRGYRVELEEVERVITSIHPTSIVAVKVQGQQLIAYVQLKDNCSIDLEILQTRVAEILPTYMLPTHYEIMANIPLTANGKIDLKGLPEIKILVNDISNSEANYEMDEVETQLKALWREVLDLKDCSVNTNFFEAGGNSLSLLEVYSKLPSSYSDIVKVADLFSYPTIKTLAKYINSKLKSKSTILNNVTFPEGFFIRGSNSSNFYTLEITLNEEQVKLFNKTANEYKTDKEILLCIIWYYLVAEISPDSTIQGLCGLNGNVTVRKITLDVKKFKTIDQLISTTRDELNKEVNYAMDDIRFDKTIERDKVSILFTKEQSKLSNFDIHVDVKKQRDQKTITILFDITSKLNKERMIEILQKYNYALLSLSKVSTPDL
ncbi:amino acid adenylation domain-containing protein [Paenibacillus taichungensis]|uniref:amino acid adenylation domain-containing protein n=1 Tax=Paenibacillus taichungensis TaxID=484184 RepID=UPI0038CF8316